MPSNATNSIAVSGRLADQVRGFAWGTTSLGPIDQWGAAQCVAVNMVLTSRFPACLALGPELIMVYNDAFVPMLGSKTLALGRSFSDVWSEAWDSIGPIADKAFGGESTFIEDFELEISRNGSLETAYFTFCYSPVCDEKGQVIGLLDTVIETTGKVLTQKRLHDFASALENEVRERTADRDRMWMMSVDCMIITDATTSVQSVNPACAAQLGWSEDDLSGTKLHDLVFEDDRADFDDQWTQAVQGSGSLRVEARVLTKGGEHVTLALSGSFHDHTMLLIARDITADREAEAALKKTEQALQQAQKMEAIGRLTGGVAHDFNNLLQVIAGNLQLLSTEVVGNEKAMRRLDNALSGVTRGAKLSSYLLAFSRKQTLEPRVVKIDAAIAGMDDMLRRTLGEEFDIEVSFASDLWNTFVDPAQVENALLNLCINARDAMDGVGRLTIEVANKVLDQAYADLHDEVIPGDYVMLAVSDTGCGMPPAVISQAFEPFFTTKPAGKGTGLGLSMIFGFVKQSGGHVKIYSEIGHGTTVKIYLPRSLDAEEVIEVMDTRAVMGGTETILVVEDDQNVQETVVETLKELGYQVLKANDATSALPIVQSGIPIDLLFTDVIMPGALKSPELARQARASLPNIAVLFTSGYTENAIVHGGKLDRGVELLGKPYTREALARRIRHVLANQKQQEQASQDLEQVRNQDSPKALKVLFVEDDEIIRGVTVELLESIGHQVIAAESAERALMALKAEVDVLITDIGLGGMSGEKLAALARAEYPRLGVVFASGGDTATAVSETVFLRKPYSLDSLGAAINEAYAVRLQSANAGA